MEYRRAYRDEVPDAGFVERHEREIFPVMKKRHLFSGASAFFLYDFYNAEGGINENVFAYTNRCGDDHALVLVNNRYESAAGWINASPVTVPQKDGTTRQDKLAEALSLHYDERYFTLLRETRSGLWFLRNSKDLHEHGLFVMLRGYEAQVYLDIHEVCDDTQGNWAKLHHELGGRGMPNPEDAMEDLAFGPLYAAFNAVFAAEDDMLAETLTAFIEEARRYVPEKSAKSDKETAARTGKTATEKAAKEIAASIKEIKEIKEAGTLVQPEKPVEKTAVKLARSKSPPDDAASADDAPFFVRAYLVLTALRALGTHKAAGENAARLAREWRLARKIRELAVARGVDRNTADHAAKTAVAALARSTPENPLTAASIVAGCLEQEDTRELLGVNVFNNVSWYNRERFHLTLRYAAFYATAEKGADAKAVAQVAKEITEADKKAEYRLETLAALLAKGKKTKKL
jgi:hypothetical protein